MSKVTLEDDEHAYIQLTNEEVLKVTFNEAGRASIIGLIEDIFPDACLFADKDRETILTERGLELRTTLTMNSLSREQQNLFFATVKNIAAQANGLYPEDFNGSN